MQTRTIPTVTLPEKFEHCAKGCNLAIALLTPDDMGGRVGSESRDARVRQNVLVELGWFWGRCGRNNLLLMSRDEIELPSDFAGLQPVRFQGSVRESVLDIDAFMHYHKVRLREE
jgi:predicted nucleotide-binding protein